MIIKFIVLCFVLILALAFLVWVGCGVARLAMNAINSGKNICNSSKCDTCPYKIAFDKNNGKNK